VTQSGGKQPIFHNVKILVCDFDGVFTDNRVFTDQNGMESVACWRSDGLGISCVKKLGIPVWVISTETNPVVSKRCEKLNIPVIQGCNDKASALEKLLDDHQCDHQDAVFVGNDINDKECLELAGIPVVVGDAYPEVTHLAVYQTIKAGGKGAVREVCDLIANQVEQK